MKYLNPLVKQFMALTMRERVFAIAALIGIIYFIFEVSLLRPQQARARALQTQIEQQQIEIEAFGKAMKALAAAPTPADPLAQQRAERDGLRAVASQADAVIAHAAADVRLLDIIRGMVAARPGMTLVSLKTLPVEAVFKPAPVVAAPEPAASGARTVVVAPLAPLYKHGIEVTVQGSYPTLVAYMQELERNTKGSFWGDAKLEIATYPDARLKMILHTLSARPELPLG